MSSFPLHLQNSYSSSSTGTSDGFHSENVEVPNAGHQNVVFNNQTSPMGSSPFTGGSVLSPSSAGSVTQPSVGSLRQFHSSSIYKSEPTVQSSGMPNAGPPMSHYSYTPSISSPMSISQAAATPPPARSTPPPSIHAPVSRKTIPTSSLSSSTNASSYRGESLSLLSKEKIEQLAKTVDPNLKLDDDVQEFLQQHAGELIDELAGMSAKLAHARKSKILEVQDVRFYLEHNWDIYIPGFGSDPIKPKRKLPETEAHKNRQALIKKHLKKF